MSRLANETSPAPDHNGSGPRAADAAELSALVDDIATGTAASERSLAAMYELTSVDLRLAVSRWVARTELATAPGTADEIVVATYAQLWRQADRRPPGVAVRTWLTALALAQLLARRRTASPS